MKATALGLSESRELFPDLAVDPAYLTAVQAVATAAHHAGIHLRLVGRLMDDAFLDSQSLALSLAHSVLSDVAQGDSRRFSPHPRSEERRLALQDAEVLAGRRRPKRKPRRKK